MPERNCLHIYYNTFGTAAAILFPNENRKVAHNPKRMREMPCLSLLYANILRTNHKQS